MSGYRELMRMKLMEELLEKMSPEEKRAFVQMSVQDSDHQEVMQALQSQSGQLDAIGKKQNWVNSFGSDVAANLFTDSLIWLGSRLFKLK